MNLEMRRSFRFVVFMSVIAILGLAAACSAQGVPAVKSPDAESTAQSTLEPTSAPTSQATTTPAAEATAEAPSAGALTEVTLFLGYIPNVQFAPVYVAVEQDFFKEEGIDLKIEHGFDETDGLTRIATDALQFGMVSGEQVLLARAHKAPVKYVYRWYQRFPIGIVSPAESNLTEPNQLVGKVVGVPGRFGASYIGLQALLASAGLTESDLKEVKAIGYDTAPVVCDKQVDASVIYIANEPAQIETRCFKVNVIQVADFANLVSNGLVTNEKTLTERPELVRAMIRAFDRGLALTIKDPELAYKISSDPKYVENLAPDDKVQMQVLLKSIELWKADRLGESDPETWKLTLEILKKMKLIETDLDAESAFTNDLLPAKS
jgi:NitT/TauT family transport system substrate-binding protein